jgi:hypothetical protein
MAVITTRLLSLKLTLVLSTALLAGLLVHVSFTAADVTPCPDPTPDPTITVSGVPVEQDHACGIVDEEGGRVQTDSPATEDNPHWTRVKIPAGFPGTVTIDEVDERFVGDDVSAAGGGGGPTCVPSSPYTCLVSNITSPTTNRNNPMVFTFTYDKSTIPPGKNIQRIRMFHDGERVPFCDVDPGEKPELEQGQDYCHVRTVRLANRDVRLVILTIRDPSWRPR